VSGDGNAEERRTRYGSPEDQEEEEDGLFCLVRANLLMIPALRTFRRFLSLWNTLWRCMSMTRRWHVILQEMRVVGREKALARSETIRSLGKSQ
jgi:hypothetical protein